MEELTYDLGNNVEQSAVTEKSGERNNNNKVVESLLGAAEQLRNLERSESALFFVNKAQSIEVTERGTQLQLQLQCKPGVSVVLPTYKGKSRIERALNSLRVQTMNRKLFEVIIVLNGPDDGSNQLISEYIERNNLENFRTLQSPRSGAAFARNLGIEAATFDHMAFLDDDDYLSPSYLKETYGSCDGSAVVLSQLYDFSHEGIVESNVNLGLLEDFKGKSELSRCQSFKSGTALTMTCIKTFPSHYAKMVKFNTDLRNGEDVVFWSSIAFKFNPRFVLTPVDRRAIYYREIRDGSLSRGDRSYEFNVTDRLSVIGALKEIKGCAQDAFIDSKIRSQAGFIIRYLDLYPNHREKVLEEVGCLHGFCDVINYINKKTSKKLVVSYCFPPWVDTSGIVAAKRMVKEKKAFDVIFSDMSKIRDADRNLLRITHELIGDSVELKTKSVAMADSRSIAEFSDAALKVAEKLNKEKGYENLYSRAMWPASHFAAALIKTRFPKIKWTAEFSDPIVTDVNSQQRKGDIDLSWVERSGLLNAVRQSGYPVLESSSIMKWCEYLAYVLADEVVFTNENQKEYMLSQEWMSFWKESTLMKSRVEFHPTLPKSFYDIVHDDWRPDPSQINIGYFGSFYSTRGLGDVLSALKEVSQQGQLGLSLDIYCGDEPDKRLLSREYGISHLVSFREKLPYFSFLARLKVYDYLLINDAITSTIKNTNPYLPSKFSDYVGSGSKLWALCEPGSTLDKIELPKDSLKSRVGDVEDIVRTLEKMRPLIGADV